ncbi:MAG: glycosyltransferase [bacterium]
MYLRMLELLKIYTFFGDGGVYAGRISRAAEYEMDFSEFYFEDFISIEDFGAGILNINNTPLEWTLQKITNYDAIKCDSTDAFFMRYQMMSRGMPRIPFLIVESDLFERAKRLCRLIENETGGNPYRTILEMPENFYLIISESYRSFYENEGINPNNLYYFPMCLESVGFSFPEIKKYVESPLPAERITPEVKAMKDKILAVGTNERDYATLVEAVRGLPLEVHIICNLKLYRAIPSHNVHWHDSMPGEQYVEALRGAKYVVIPLKKADRNYGQMSTVLPMSLGKAVIATEVEALRDHIKDGETGLFVKSGDAGSVRRAIQLIEKDETLRKKTGQGARRREKELSDIAARTIDELLNRVRAMKGKNI